MDDLFGLLGGGLILFIAVPLGLTLFFVLPWWALIDLIRRRDIDDTRVVWGIFLVLLWGFSSILYALFSTRSRGLRVTMLLCLAGVPLALGGAFAAAYRANRIHAVEEAEQAARILAEFKPESLDAASLQPVLASRSVDGRGFQVGLFRLDGPAEDTLRPVGVDCTWVTLDTRRGQHYCLSWRGLTRIDFEAQLTTEITPATDEDFGHLGGLIYDAVHDRVIVASNSGTGGLFAYHPAEDRWRKLAVPGEDFNGLAWSPEDEVFYSLPLADRDLLRTVRRYNVHGALVDEIDLAPQIPLREQGHLQIAWRDGWLFVVPADGSVFAVDPVSGTVYAAG